MARLRTRNPWPVYGPVILRHKTGLDLAPHPSMGPWQISNHAKRSSRPLHIYIHSTGRGCRKKERGSSWSMNFGGNNRANKTPGSEAGRREKRISYMYIYLPPPPPYANIKTHEHTYRSGPLCRSRARVTPENRRHFFPRKKEHL